MPQYDNPASFLADPSEFQSGGMPNFMSGVVAGQRQQQAAPFLAELLKQQQMSTQQQAIEQQEFQSLLAIQQRQSQRQKIIDEGDVYNQTKGDTIAQSHEKARLAPFMTDEQIEQAKLGATVAQHQTASEPIKYFSSVFDHLQKVPEEQRPALYNQFVNMSGYDKQKLPPDLATYQPSTLGHLAMARYAQVHDAEQEKKLAQEQVPAQASRDVAAIQGQYRLAEINRQIQGGIYGDIGRRQGVLERSLRSNIDPDTGKPMDDSTRQATMDSLRRIKSKNVMDYVQKQTQMAQMTKMVGALSGDPIKAQAANDAYEKEVQNAYRQGLQIEGLSPQDFAGSSPVQQGNAPKQVRLGGDVVTVVKTNPDGTMVVRNKNGQEKTVRMKQ